MQERFIGWKTPITSMGANKKYSGIIDANVYRGFNSLVPGVGLSFTINHLADGEVFTNQNESLSNPLGVWISRQGVVIKESEAIPLSLITNSGNSSVRIDYLIGRHLHDILQEGGVAATYEIVKGPLGSSALPTLTNPEDSVILGKFIIEANASSLAGVKWQRNRAPMPGGKSGALLSEQNIFTDQNNWAQKSANLSIVSADYELAARGVLNNIDNGNTFIVDSSFNFLDLLPDKPNGTTIYLRFTGAVTIRGFVDNLVSGKVGTGVRSGYSAGLRAISLLNDVKSLNVSSGQVVTLQKLNIGGAFTLGSVFEYGDMWKVIAVSDSGIKVQKLEADLAAINTSLGGALTTIAQLTELINNINPPRSLTDIDFIGTLSDHFDITGKALPTSVYYGRAICNGQNATPDLRGRVRASYSDVDPNYSAVGFISGNNFITLLKAQLPTDRLAIPYQWGNWRGNNSSANYGTVGALEPINPSGTGFNRNGRTEPMGSGAQIDIRNSYRVVLTLMWVGIPTP